MHRDNRPGPGVYLADQTGFQVKLLSTNGQTRTYAAIFATGDEVVAHTHVTVSTEDGPSHGGHLIELFVGPTLEVFVTVEPMPLFKRLNPEFDAGVIDPTLEK